MNNSDAERKPGAYSHLRVHYSQAPFSESDLAPTPLEQFERWFADAVADNLPEPNAMVVSTVNQAGQPSSRHVLLKEVQARGFVFYTNYESQKGQDLAANPNVALVFPWFGMFRQVVVQGVAERVGRDETENYFHSRPHDSQVGAWISQQSRVLESYAELQARTSHFQSLYPEGTVVPVPENWGGFLVRPVMIEFWAGRESRLHDRLRFFSISGKPAELDSANLWKVQRLYP